MVCREPVAHQSHVLTLRRRYSHPCPKGMHCTNPSPWHMQQFIHLDEVKSRHAASLQMPTADCILKPENVHTAARLQVFGFGFGRVGVQIA